MNAYIIKNTDFYRGTRLDSMQPEQRENARINLPEDVPPGQANESPKDQAENQADEKIQLWMNNIKEFIRGIDVKSL